jgi:hypothetical protein
VPGWVMEPLRNICTALPEVIEQPAWIGRRWRIRQRTFAHVFCLDQPSGIVPVVQFRSSGDELDALLGTGHPFFKAGWGTDVVNMVLSEATDWSEVAELITESYCTQAPKKLVALVDRPA